MLNAEPATCPGLPAAGPVLKLKSTLWSPHGSKLGQLVTLLGWHLPRREPHDCVLWLSLSSSLVPHVGTRQPPEGQALHQQCPPGPDMEEEL